VRYCAPEASHDQHELMTKHATTLLERLGLPYRVKLLAAGDTGFASAKTYDLETYAPGVGAWLEVSSSSTFTDFQARRAWKSVNVLLDDTSSQAPTPGAYVSRS
jgi:seryl-tRNA synthetase